LRFVGEEAAPIDVVVAGGVNCCSFDGYKMDDIDFVAIAGSSRKMVDRSDNTVAADKFVLDLDTRVEAVEPDIDAPAAAVDS